MNAAQDVIGGRYRLLEIIGAGGMGRVWLADDELLRRRVAVKEIRTPTGVSTAQMLDAQLTTMREARAAARLEHPGVVGVYDVVWRPDRSWIVMEYVESRSLDQVVREAGRLPHREAARIGLGVLAALRAAHAAGVLHRDVKPHNVLLATDGRVVLTDFGLATIRGTEQGDEPLLGSPYFVAPERLRGTEAGEAGDLWSLGATLYTAVEGQEPFRKATTADSLTAVLHEPPAPARFAGPLTAVIDKLLTKDPAQRLSAAEAEDRLRRVADRAVGIFPMRPANRRTPAAIGTSAVIASPRPDEQQAAPARRGIARSTRFALIAAAVLLTGTAGTALALDARPAPTPAGQVTVEPVAGAVTGCSAGGPPVTGSAQTRGYAVPAGWLWHADPTGFEVAVPKGWTRTQEGTAACFRDPGGSRSFLVDASARPDGPALTYWQDEEQTATAAGTLPGYQRVALATLPAAQGGAAWEFTWQPAGEPVRRHERRVLRPAGAGRAYLVEWTAPEPDWVGTEPYLQLVLASLS